jgi:hypothetical protein
MRDFFYNPRRPASRPPAIVHAYVCRDWGQAVIEDPHCWTSIWITVDSDSFSPCGDQDSVYYQTESGGFCDTLRTYFARAGRDV